MEAVELAVIKGQLTHIITSLEAVASKQEAMAVPLQDQSVRIARVEGKLDDMASQITDTSKSSMKAHSRIDDIDKTMAYIKGAVAAMVFMLGFLAWALKDQLEISRSLPVLVAERENRLKAAEEKIKTLENQIIIRGTRP